VYAASKKLHRLLRVSESFLDDFAEELSIDFHSPFGTHCPGIHCPLKRSLTIGEVHQGWELINSAVSNLSSNKNNNNGDDLYYYSNGSSSHSVGSVYNTSMSPTKLATELSNKYTTKCIHCNTEFIPRFHVMYKSNSQLRIADEMLLSSSPNNGGDEATSIWCEFLSPWVVTKEILNILYSTSELLMQKNEDDENEVDTGDGIGGDHVDGVRLLSKLFVPNQSLNTIAHSTPQKQPTSKEPLRLQTSPPVRQRTVSSAKLQQRAVIFWNMLVAFRLRGLPFGFLLANNFIYDSFPPPPTTCKKID